MNHLSISRALTFLSITVLFTACSEDNAVSMQETSTESAMEHAEKHLDSNYVCPMHPQIVKGEPGNCPICGMDLVEKKPVQKTAEKKILYWVAPMDPAYRRDEPGQSPMGMDLVPVYDDGSQNDGSDHPQVSISPQVINNMGVRTARVERKNLSGTIRTLGRIEYDETRLAHLHPKAAGWVEKLSVKAEGEEIRKGQYLGDFYSPDILSAQVDYLIALNQGKNYPQLKLDKARNRLRLLGVDDNTIKRIAKNRQSQNTVPLVAPANGIITLLGAREGMYVPPQMELFTIADLDRMWVMVDVYEHQLNWVEKNASAEMRIPAYPGKVWQGQVEYLYPELDRDSRTLRVRLAFDNSDHKLRPNMFADVVIRGKSESQVLTVPREALIVTGERETIIKSLGNGKFQPVDVVSGRSAEGSIEIKQGLEENDEVVISGQFLIDSESSLRASYMRMSGE